MAEDAGDSLVSVYRAPDMAAAAFLVSLLEGSGIPVWQQDVGIGALPRARYGTWGYRIMVRREDCDHRAEDITAAVREFEKTMGYPPTQ
jgi:hypothetical protein